MIELVTDRDLVECTELIRNSFLTIANKFNITIENAPRFTAFSVTEEKLRKQFNDKDRVMFKITENDKIVGYYSFHFLSTEVAELNNLCVSLECRHKGYGKLLLAHATSYAKSLGYKEIDLSIVEENQSLKKWYMDYGFIPYEVKKFDFFPFTCGYLRKILE